MADPWQTTDDLREHLLATNMDGETFFEDNPQQRFDELLETLEARARDIIINRLGDQPIGEEIERVDVVAARDTATLTLVYPVNEVHTVERRVREQEWKEMEPRRYRVTDHGLVLHRSRRSTGWQGRHGQNPLLDYASRQTWIDIADQIRVTYDRGFDPIPLDLIQVQTDIVVRLLRNLRTEQNIAAMEADQIAAVTQARAVLADDIKDRIDSFQGLGGKSRAV